MKISSAAAAAAAADAVARQRSQQQISRAADTVAADVASLRTAVGNTPDFSGFDRDIAAAGKYLDRAKADAAKAGTKPEHSTACDSAHAARDDEHAVQDAANGVQDDSNGLEALSDQ